MNPKVDFFFEKEQKWHDEVEKLRTTVLDCGLSEELKWGCPCYTFQDANVVLIHTFKEYCALLFFKGALLNNPDGILIQQTENVQVARQIRFSSLQQITRLSKTLKAYIYEAIEVEKAGLIPKLKKTTEFKMPEEFEKRLNKNASLKKAFHALTPGRQRGYLLHFSSAKQLKTRESRIDKAVPLILKGKGLDE
jgi:uncharacterized protein YdeI (YjbR/CyaY-like superfamily)